MAIPSSLGSKLDVIVIGAAGIDTNVYLYGDDVDFTVEANFTQNVDYVGQAGGYYAKGFARMGLKTGYIGFVGDDYLGKFLLNDFQNNKIDLSHVGIDPVGTKRSINIMYKNGQRKNFYDGKGHMELQLSFNQIDSYLSRAKLIHFNLMNWSRHLIPRVKEMGKIISCDLQDIVDIKDPYRQDFMKQVDFLFFSCVNFVDYQPLLRYIFKINPTVQIIIGRGAQGCVYAKASQTTPYSAVEMENWPIVDTNGAGDSLGVGFLSSFLFHGYSVEESIQRGQLLARHTCGLKASSDLLTKDQLDHLFDLNILN